MAIIQITTDILGETGVNPRTVRIVCNDSLGTITTAGYLNPAVLQGYTILPTDFVFVMYGTNGQTPGIFTPTISNGIITLVELPDSSGGVTLPVVDGDFAVFSGTSGLIKDAGYAPSDPTLNSVVMTENPGNFASHIGVFADTAGTLFSDAATAINGGDIQAGDPVHAANGSLISSYGGANGKFIITGAANMSPVDTTLTNAPMGQATVISIPDPGASTANVLLSSSSSTQHITTGDFEVDNGNIIAGSNGVSGSFISFPSGSNQGMFSFAASPVTANHTVILTNSSSFGQTTTITVPDPSVSNASLLIDNFSGTQHIATGNIEVDAGNIVAGNISSPGSFITYGGSGSGGYLQIACDFLTNPSQIIVTTSDILQSTLFTIPDPSTATAFFIISDFSGTQHITSGGLGVDKGNITAGSDNNPGQFISFPAGAAKGALQFYATPITGNFLGVVTNADFGQETVFTLPDPTNSNANFIVSNFSGTQHITSGSLSVDQGSINAGSSGHNGTVISFPTTATNGRLIWSAVNSPGNFDTIVSNRAMGQSTTFSIGDPGQATASILTSKVVADVGANLISFDVTVTAAALAGAGSVVIIASSGSKQYKMRSLYLNSSATNFSGGGGDRLGLISDGASTVFSLIPAATMQALANSTWGSTNIPFPSGQSLNQSSAAGSSIVFQYSGGSADYSTGTVVISGIVERVA